MADQEAQITVARAALKEMASLSHSEKNRIVSFLERLVQNPYHPSLIEQSQVSGDFFASRLPGGVYIYWSLESNGLNTAPKINFLGLRRKAVSRGVVLAKRLNPA